MTDRQYAEMWADAMKRSDRDEFVRAWPDEPGAGNLYDVATADFKTMLNMAGRGQTELSRDFGIPLRAVQHWVTGDRECPSYTRMMLARLLGLI